ncbi:hypothetical protein D3C75_1096160 [compost metagenome]
MQLSPVFMYEQFILVLRDQSTIPAEDKRHRLFFIIGIAGVILHNQNTFRHLNNSLKNSLHFPKRNNSLHRELHTT